VNLMTLSLYFQAFDAVEFREEGDGRYVGRIVLHDTIQVKSEHKIFKEFLIGSWLLFRIFVLTV
jgi:hypothetical protein